MKPSLYLALVPFILGQAFAQSASKPAMSAELTAAQGLYAQGHFAEAEAAAKKLTDGDKYSIAGLQLRARLEMAANSLSAAQGDLLQARRLDIHNRTTLQLLGEAFWRADKFADAAPFLEQVDRVAQARQAQALAATEAYRVEGLGMEDRIKLLRVDPVPVVAVRLNGGAVQYFAVDPGGSEVVLDTSVAAGLDLPDLGFGPGGFSTPDAQGPSARAAHSVLPALAVGLWVVHDVPVTVQSTAAYGADIRGVVGAEFLAHFVSTLDFKHGELRLLRRSGTRGAETDVARRQRLTAAGAKAVPLHFVGEHFLVMDAALGADAVNATAVPWWFSLGPTNDGPSQVPVRIGQLAGTAQAWPAGAENMASGVHVYGILGAGFFRNSAVTLDTGNMLLWIEK